ncbi:MAG: M23 family metallopeptidase [Gammaproteobacteria bacterium]|nr:M23 family metallopeptidase [Gammaproteobacteria bacterium]
MKVILFHRTGAARQYSLSSFVVMLAVSFVLFVGIGGFVGGYWLARDQAGAVPLAELAEVKNSLTAYQSTVDELRNESRENLDALALRVGELNASVIRLNALGRRLTGMAGLEDGEFDFDNPPALGGGPEIPAVATAGARATSLLADIEALDDSLFVQEAQLNVLEDLLLNRKLRQRVYPKGRPVRAGYISSSFGRRTDPFTGKSAWHRGVDFAGKRGAEIVAVAAGVVTWSGDRFGYGKMVEINHGNGYVTRYAHNEENLVAVGDHVKQGQTIARMGSSGRATGPNLHFEVRHLGRPVNPWRHIQQTT